VFVFLGWGGGFENSLFSCFDKCYKFSIFTLAEFLGESNL